jgi:hypothetical protein
MFKTEHLLKIIARTETPSAAGLFPLRLPIPHGLFNFISKGGQVPSQSIKHLLLRLVGGEVSGQGAFRRVPAQLFQMGLIVLHVASLNKYEKARPSGRTDRKYPF